MTIEKVSCEGPGLTAAAVSSPVKGTLAGAVRLPLTGAGAFKGRVIASVRCADGAAEETLFDVSAYGIEANKR